jgi:hypothetical protein
MVSVAETLDAVTAHGEEIAHEIGADAPEITEGGGVVICRFVNGPVVTDDQPRHDVHVAGADEPPGELRMAEVSPGSWVPVPRDAPPWPDALVYQCIGIAGHVVGVRIFLFHTTCERRLLISESSPSHMTSD